MASTSTVTQELQDQFLATVRKSQEVALDAIKTMVDTIQNITPKVPSVNVPFADRLPKPEDVVASGYEFAEQLLTSQRKFADEVVKATAPLLPGKGEAAEGRRQVRQGHTRCPRRRPSRASSGQRSKIKVRGSSGTPELPRTLLCAPEPVRPVRSGSDGRDLGPVAPGTFGRYPQDNRTVTSLT